MRARPYLRVLNTLARHTAPSFQCLFGNKLTSGVVVNIGFGQTFVVPVVRGHIIRDAVKTIPRMGGAALTQFYQMILDQLGVDLDSDSLPEITVARNLKERTCEAWPTPLAAHLGVAAFSANQLRQRSDVPMKEVDFEGRIFALG